MTLWLTVAAKSRHSAILIGGVAGDVIDTT